LLLTDLAEPAAAKECIIAHQGPCQAGRCLVSSIQSKHSDKKQQDKEHRGCKVCLGCLTPNLVYGYIKTVVSKYGLETNDIVLT
jgi:hypothetical protein